MSHLLQRLALTCSIAPALLAQTASAADQVPAQPAESPAEIVVTATRHAEPLSKIAQSVSAMNEAALDQRGIKGIADIATMTPGVTLNPNGFGSQADISIRGISSQVGSATTGIYIDDTPIQTRVVGYSATNTYPQVFDLDRVEVLRGPQGTLFGSGAEGGAVRFITPSPSLDATSVYGRAELSGTRGGDASGEAGLAVGAPIVRGSLGFRASLWYRRDGGYIDRQNLNPDLGGTAPITRNANSADTVVGRVALTWKPAASVSITPSLLVQDRRIHDISTFWEGAENLDHGHLVNGQPLAQPDHDSFALGAVRAEVTLPGVTVISNTSYFARVENAIDDYSTLNPAIFVVPSPSNYVPGDPAYTSATAMRNVQTALTEELRAQSSDRAAKVSWVLGVFLSSARQTADEAISDPKFAELFGLPVGAVPLVDGQYSLIARSIGKDRQAAAFGEIGWHLTPTLKLTAGLRVAVATFIGEGTATGPFIGDTIVTPRTSTTETPVTPKFSAAWQATPDTLIYATAAKGYRIGGSNAPLSNFCNIGAQGYASVPMTYRSDSLWSYEAGAKTRLFDRHLDLAASAFHVNWHNIQQLVYVSNCGQQFVDNLGAAKSDGFDAQIALRPFTGLTLDGAIGYTTATFTRTVPLLVQQGNHIDTQPWSGTFGVNLDQPIGERIAAYARLDYTWHSRSALTPLLDSRNGGYDPAALPAPATNLVNLRAGARIGQIDASAFIDNLFNSRPLLTRYSEVLGNPVHRDFTFRPLTAGVTVTWRY